MKNVHRSGMMSMDPARFRPCADPLPYPIAGPLRGKQTHLPLPTQTQLLIKMADFRRISSCAHQIRATLCRGVNIMCVWVIMGSAWSDGLATTLADDSTSQATEREIEFFEKRVRPVLSNHCLECHGAEAQEGGVRLDSKDAMVNGGQIGPLIVPGNSNASRIMQVVGYADDQVQMPPDTKLPDNSQAVLKRWIDMGAPWPATDSDTGVASPQPINFESIRNEHWAFRPVAEPAIPTVKRTDLINNSVDHFVEARLEATGSHLAPRADRYRLIRRATLDLIGVPPTFAEVQQFVSDPDADAFEKVIDRLLASPMYGQRWGRYWLDVARYGDTKGYVFQQEPRYPWSYTYRDYIVRSFNHDKPYDQFLREQIAADQLGLDDQDPDLAALGFLTVGHRFLNKQEEIIDDRIDVISRGLMGITLACARCHDHKFEPIEMTDYYALYGVFANCYEPDELPIIGDPTGIPEYNEFKKEFDKRERALSDYVSSKEFEILGDLRMSVRAYLTAVANSGASLKQSANLKNVNEKGPTLRPELVQLWKTFIERTRNGVNPVFAPWHAFAELPSDRFEEAARELMEDFEKQAKDDSLSTDKLNPIVVRAIVNHFPSSMQDVAAIYGDILEEIELQWRHLQQDAAELGKTVERFDDDSQEQLRLVLYLPDSPFGLAERFVSKLYERDVRNEIDKLERSINQLEVESRGAPARAMVLLDSEKISPQYVFLRGDAGRRGPEVERRFPRILSAENEMIFEQGSGRLELAEAIASPANPLTARVMVNRVWLHHFGDGLVRTPGDFGVQGDAPTHPELLDHLTSSFIHEGWSIKQLHRKIMLSATYQQTSDDRPELRSADPENRNIWRMNRRRLDFEAMRDSMLAVSGLLDTALDGRPVDLFESPLSPRRSVYGLINRNDLSGVLRTFDFPNPDAASTQRTETTVPQQALFGMNSPFVIEVATATAALSSESAQDDRQTLNTLYRLILSRDAEPDEIELGLSFIESRRERGQAAMMSPWDALAQGLLLTNEFMFVD